MLTWIKVDNRYIHIRIATEICIDDDDVIRINFSGHDVYTIRKAHEPKAYKKIVDYLKEEIKG